VIELTLREKSIQLANESEAKSEALRRKIEEEELKQGREAFYEKFGEYPDRVWRSYPFLFASKDGLTFKLYYTAGNVDYFYITNPEYPYEHLSDKLTSLTDLGRYLKRPENNIPHIEPKYSDNLVVNFSREEIGQEPEIEEKHVGGDKHKPKRMLRLNDNQEDGRTGSGD